MFFHRCIFATQADDQVLWEGESRSSGPLERDQRVGRRRTVLHQYIVSTPATEAFVADSRCDSKHR